jgi:ERCC4-type nuclease
MKVIIDERETELYEKCYSIVNTEGNTTFVQLQKKVLPLGDIIIQTDEDKDVMIIERKSFSDLLSSIKDGRYEEQSHRLIHSSGFPLHNIVYILEGMLSQLHSIVEKKTIYSTMASLNYFKGFSVFRTSTVRETAELIVWMANKIDRDFVKGKIPHYLMRTPSNTVSSDTTSSNGGTTVTATVTEIQPPNYCTVVKKTKKENITSENIGEILLCQIPGISSTTAIAIMKEFETFPDFLSALHENPQFLDTITYETNGKKRKITKNSVESIKQYFYKPPTPSPSTSSGKSIPLDNSSPDTNQDK